MYTCVYIYIIFINLFIYLFIQYICTAEECFNPDISRHNWSSHVEKQHRCSLHRLR